MPVNLDIYKAVVQLTYTAGTDKVSSLGSGVVFTPTGLVITNNHVIEDADFGTAFGQVSVQSVRGVDRPASDPVPAEVVIRSEAHDLAVVRITGVSPTHFIDLLKVPPTNESLIERRIRVLGFPPLGGGTITVTRGVVSGFDEVGNLKTDAEINPGNSGGAAFDDLDSFLGIPSFIVAGKEGKLGFLISADRVKQWLAAALKSGLPATTEELGVAFGNSNLDFSGDNLDQSTKYPRILGKFAAVEKLLSQGEYEKSIPHINFILEKRPRSGLAHHYLGNAFLGLGRYLDAAAEYRTALAYNPNHIPALGNYGVTLCHLGRHGEALQIFEQIIDATDNPAELYDSYSNIAQIYETWKRPDVGVLYKQKAAELSVAAAERLAQYKPPQDSHDKIAAITNAIMNAEIEMED